MLSELKLKGSFSLSDIITLICGTLEKDNLTLPSTPQIGSQYEYRTFK